MGSCGGDGGAKRCVILCLLVEIRTLYNTLDSKMTYWADNIKFVKDIIDSKYKKIDDAIADMEEHVNHLNENKDNKKARDGFIEATRALELMNFDEVEGLAETMFKDMPEAEREKEQTRMKDYKTKFDATLSQIKDNKAKFAIKS